MPKSSSKFPAVDAYVARAAHHLQLVPQADRRVAARRRLYVGDGLAVRVSFGDVTLAGEAIDLSPHGIGVALDARVEDAPKAGDDVVVEYAPRHAPKVELAAAVVHVTEGSIVGRPMVRVGLRVLPSPGSSRLRVRQPRAGERYPCAELMPVVAAASSPVFFREVLHFRVQDVSAGGLTLTTSLRNKELVKGLELALRVHLPMIGEVAARAVVRSIRRDDAARSYRVGVRFAETPPALHAALAEYVLMTTRHATPAALRESGFTVASMERAVRWDYAASRADYARILELRLAAHRHEGRWLDRTVGDMASTFDAHARHVVGRFAGRIVASGRVAFVDGDPARSEYVTRGGHVVPDWLWKAGFCESGANAVDPEFQRTDLYVALLRHAVRVTLQSGYRYVLGASPPPLVKAYLKLGCTVLEEREVSPSPNWRFLSTLMVIDVDKLARENDNGVFAPVFDFLEGQA